MYCILMVAGVIRGVSRVESASDCPAAAALPTGNPSNGTLLVMEPSDVRPNPFVLSEAEGALIAAAVGAVWAGAWGWKALVRALNTDGTTEESST